MKYVLCERTRYKTVLNEYTNTYESNVIHEYGCYRIGRIFGFKHPVGEWMVDSQGNNFCFEDWHNTEKKAISYAQCWHKEMYDDKYAFKLVRKQNKNK